MKLTVIGAGGFRTPAIYQALVGGAADVSFDEIVLYDADDSRFGRITAVLDGIDAELGAHVGYRMSTNLRDAVEGADVVYCAIRVGGLEGRLKDERIAVDAGVIGQETTGPGGLAFALRTVPAVLEIAEQVAAHAPSALFVNFTNPAGLVTEALRRVLGDRVVGICDGPPTSASGSPPRSGCPATSSGSTTSASTTWAGYGRSFTAAATCCPTCWPTRAGWRASRRDACSARAGCRPSA